MLRELLKRNHIARRGVSLPTPQLKCSVSGLIRIVESRLTWGESSPDQVAVPLLGMHVGAFQTPHYRACLQQLVRWMIKVLFILCTQSQVHSPLLIKWNPAEQLRSKLMYRLRPWFIRIWVEGGPATIYHHSAAWSMMLLQYRCSNIIG